MTVLGGDVGHPAYDAIKAKVLGFLRDCRARFGQAKIDEVKNELVLEMEKYRTNRKITDEELRERIDLLFFEIDASRVACNERQAWLLAGPAWGLAGPGAPMHCTERHVLLERAGACLAGCNAVRRRVDENGAAWRLNPWSELAARHDHMV